MQKQFYSALKARKKNGSGQSTIGHFSGRVQQPVLTTSYALSALFAFFPIHT
jgi:hypothetical protein